MAHFGVLFPTLIWFLYLLSFFSNLPMAICDETEIDRQALLCFKSGLSGQAGVLASWSNMSLDVCSWHGITCSTLSPRRVIALDLESEGISGSIPRCISKLTALTRLQLSNNNFHGEIPSELGTLSQLSNLNLSMNTLEGNIPSQLGACLQLQILDLRSNSLHGEIPPNLGQCKNLQKINLRNNTIQGSIPSSFGDLPELHTLVLASNMLTGNIPPSLGSSHSLTYVYLGMNALTGIIPVFLANSSSLKVLSLMNNNLIGELPKALFNTSSLLDISLQQNNLVGSFLREISTSATIQYLDLRNNHISGKIPSSLGNLSSLVDLLLTSNDLFGSIPDSLGHIPTLERLAMSVNNLYGTVPLSLFNMSSLTFLGLANNSLVGSLPSNIGYTLPNIQELILSTNRFDGPIPASLAKAYNLRKLYLYNNSLTGSIPLFGSLTNLEELMLAYNKLEAGNWGFISSLKNCSRLTKLVLSRNNLEGRLPNSISELSDNLEWLWLGGNKIFGHIPLEIGNLKSLKILYMDNNLITGNIPATIGNLYNMVFLSFAQNRISGQIPNNTIGNLVHLSSLELDGNNLSGSIPPNIGRCNQLQSLNLAHNSLDGSIPGDIFQISSLSRVLDLSHNYLSGGVPLEVGSLINLNRLIISNNRLSGNIPSTLGQCRVLEYLEMQSNFIGGSIPKSVGNLLSIKRIDISHNNLSGKIPEFFATLGALQDLNLSFNNFEGDVPRGGIFDNFQAVSVEGNDNLCTTSISIESIAFCSTPGDKEEKHSSLALVLRVVMPTIVLVILILLCVALFILRKRMQVKTELSIFSGHIRNISYEDIVRATNRFSSANIVGSGSFGVVYKGSLMCQEDEVAIKVFNLNIFGANRSFIAECESLRNVRHRNLVKVITSCSSVDSAREDFKALVFQYMPNGNLEMWLHPKSHEHVERHILTLRQRIKICLDVAFALDYLHNQCASPIIHCDLKPSNILLDLDMVAYVTDFGLSRFIFTTSNMHQDSSTKLSHLKGSIGYIPPEYGMSEGISTNGDVYSFGILLLQMMTGRSPTDGNFDGSASLHEFVDRAFPNNVHEVADLTMLQDGIDVTEVMRRCVIPLVKVGLSCSITSRRERPDMGKVSTEILRILHVASHMGVL